METFAWPQIDIRPASNSQFIDLVRSGIAGRILFKTNILINSVATYKQDLSFTQPYTPLILNSQILDTHSFIVPRLQKTNGTQTKYIVIL